MEKRSGFFVPLNQLFPLYRSLAVTSLIVWSSKALHKYLCCCSDTMNISEYGYQFFIFKTFYQLKDIHSRLFTLSLTFFLSFDRFCHVFLINHYFLHKKCKKIDKKCRNFPKKSSTKTVIPLTVNKIASSGVFVPL